MADTLESQTAYRRPFGIRLFLGLFALFLAAMCLALPLLGQPTPGFSDGRWPPDTLATLLPIYGVAFLGLFPAALFLYFAGPNDVVLDWDRREWRLRRGFPLAARWERGPFTDLAGVRFVRNPHQTATLFLAWAEDTRRGQQVWGDVWLTASRDRAAAEAQADVLATRLGLPRLPPDPDAADRTRRRLALPVALMALFFLVWGLLPLWVTHTLTTEGRSVTGQVLSLRRSKSFSVRYAYSFAGRPYTGRDRVTRPTWEALSPGDSVGVRCLPAFPRTSRLDAGIGGDTGWVIVAYGVFFFGVSLYASRAGRRR